MDVPYSAAVSASTSTSTSTWAAPSSSNCNDFDIFISHRGPDTKKVFASLLYRRLRSGRLRVFLDQQELQQGDSITTQIKDAITTASIHVAIFSLGYADSRWCLEELVLMSESKGKIIPVFYDVKPAELWHTEGLYAKALQNHASRYDATIIEKWRTALSEVAGISGFELESCNGDVGELLDKVVDSVLRRVKRSPFNVAKYPTGLDNKVTAMSVGTSTSTSTRAAPSSSNCHDFDIFISHRGPDTKKVFASLLYRHLRRLGGNLRVFLDQPELQQGDRITPQIKNAITTASVHVGIFSPGYADSAWCLDELVDMLESKGKIIPVFYDVKPAELRWCTGRYGKALEDHKSRSRHDDTTIEKWTTALSEVAHISGFELEACKGDVGELLDKVVHSVLRMLKIAKNPTGLDDKVAKYATGLDDKVTDFENRVSLQTQQSGEPQIVGIVGLGGVGKTTLAKELFNRKSSNYNRCCFLSNVRENAAKGLIFLQRELLKNLADSDEDISSVVEGIEMLEKKLSGRHAIIILDDVNQQDQVDALLRARHVLDPDSLLLITSRDEHFLRSSGVKVIYELSGLNPQHSRELFCSHAFYGDHPLSGFEDVVEELLEACGGFPLSLKVLGAHLCGKLDITYWNQQLDVLPKMRPVDISEVLKISYEGLGAQEKQIFLDIACFFVGENKDMALRIWEGSGWQSYLGFQNLEDKCLVEVHSGNIHMHDCLQDLGRQIEEASTSARRFWRHTESTQSIDDLLQQYSSGKMEVRGIRMLGMSTHESWRHDLIRLQNDQRDRTVIRELQLIDTEDGLLELILRTAQSPNLTWLRWSNCPTPSLPCRIQMENLRVLHVMGSFLKTLWQDESQAPVQLQELVIVAPLLKLPESIGLLKKLEVIVLDYQTSNLESLPNEICQLQSLKRFELANCSKIKSLPDSFGDLTNLEHINLSHSYYLRTLPNSFAKLIQLRYLDLSYCYNLTMSSNTLGNISKLEYIDISCCTKIKTLPPQVGLQRSLQNLHFLCTHFKELPAAIGDLRDLEFLVIECPFLEMLPSSLGNLANLRKLMLRHCKVLKCLPDSVKLLNRVIVYDCGFGKLSFGGETERLRQLKGKGLMSNLASSIEYSYMPRPPLQINKEISEVSVPRLQHLLIESCNDLVEVGILPNTLITLQLKLCRNLKKIEGLGSLTKLKMLDISQCTELEELPSIETLLSLLVLKACACVKLKSMRGFAHLKELRLLDVSECSELQELQGVEHLGSSLDTLDANKCPKLHLLQASSWPWPSRQVMCMALLLITFTCINPAWLWRLRQVMCLSPVQAKTDSPKIEPRLQDLLQDIWNQLQHIKITQYQTTDQISGLNDRVGRMEKLLQQLQRVGMSGFIVKDPAPDG